MATISPLVELISKNAALLQEAAKKNGHSLPDANSTTFDPHSEDFRSVKEADEAANLIVSAALQLAATLAPPPVALYQVAGGFFKSAAVRMCLESNVTEILREAGPKGLHVDEIAKQNGQDPKKLSRCLRFLATHHIFREVVPEVFTNTRLSCLMDSGASCQDILANPEKKHENAQLVSVMSLTLDEGFKGCAYSWESVATKELAFSGEPIDSGVPIAFGVQGKESIWQIYEKEPFRRKRFDMAMRGGRAIETHGAALDGYDWASVPKGSLIVDVGGGIGSISHSVWAKYPELRFVIQDLAPSIENGKAWWAKTSPEAIESGKVKLQVHDFFTPQPVKDADIFLVKTILHDWSDDYCVKILKHLRAAATPKTTLVVMDTIIPYACPDPEGEKGEIVPGAYFKPAPEPLLANYGSANIMGYLGDMSMWVMFNSQERTVKHFQSLLLSTGWKLKSVIRRKGGDSTFVQTLDAVPC